MVDLMKMKGIINGFLFGHIMEEPERSKRIAPVMEMMQDKEAQEALVANADNFAFYEIVSELGLPKSLIEQRQELERYVINNSEKYSTNRVVEALCGLLFRNNSHNMFNILTTLKGSAASLPEVNKEYKPYAKLFEEVFNLIENRQINADELKARLKEILKLIKQAEKLGKKIHEATSYLMDFARKESGKDLTKSTSETKRIFSNIEPEQLTAKNGDEVKFYKIKNQTESQKHFTMLARTFDTGYVLSNLNTKQKMIDEQARYRAWSYSVINESKLSTYSRRHRVMFGYFDVGEVGIASATFRDGQTNQFPTSVNQPFFQQQFTTVEELVAKTRNNSYNEIRILNTTPIIPSVVISRGEEPTEEELELAQALDIPIIFIDKTCYEEAVFTGEIETPEINRKISYEYPSFLEEPLTDVIQTNATA